MVFFFFCFLFQIEYRKRFTNRNRIYERISGRLPIEGLQRAVNVGDGTSGSYISIAIHVYRHPAVAHQFTEIRNGTTGAGRFNCYISYVQLIFFFFFFIV